MIYHNWLAGGMIFFGTTTASYIPMWTISDDMVVCSTRYDPKPIFPLYKVELENETNLFKLSLDTFQLITELKSPPWPSAITSIHFIIRTKVVLQLVWGPLVRGPNVRGQIVLLPSQGCAWKDCFIFVLVDSKLAYDWHSVAAASALYISQHNHDG
jgi:hypothetical protein